MVNDNVVFSSIDTANYIAGAIVNIAAASIIVTVVVAQFVDIDVDGSVGFCIVIVVIVS